MYYDESHTMPRFSTHVYLRISKNYENGYYLQNYTKLSFNKVGPFKILESYRGLVYKLDLLQ